MPMLVAHVSCLYMLVAVAVVVVASVVACGCCLLDFILNLKENHVDPVNPTPPQEAQRSCSATCLGCKILGKHQHALFKFREPPSGIVEP
jgi:hypothetical protein